MKSVKNGLILFIRSIKINDKYIVIRPSVIVLECDNYRHDISIKDYLKKSSVECDSCKSVFKLCGDEYFYYLGSELK